MPDSSPIPLSFDAYDRSRVTPGVLHLGLGGFHRAHMARYIHDLMIDDSDARSWGIVAAGMRPSDVALIQALKSQHCLYTLIERDQSGERREVIGSIAAVIDASASSAELLDRAENPHIRIVSLTVTEHGYHLEPATKRLDLRHPAIVDDLAGPASPRTPVGIVTAILARRRAAASRPPTVLSCDNIQHNGDVVRRAIGRFAAAVDPSLAEWIEQEVDFPNSMVDRITPQPSKETIAAFQKQTGVRDAAPLVSEPFRQWVVEDRFRAGRPRLGKVGVQFVPDVSPYERMKLRLLNASHLALAGPGELMGLDSVSAAMADPDIRRFVEALMENETAPTVGHVPGIDLAEYGRSVVERFANPAIPDTVARINADAPLNYLLDPIRDRLADGRPIDLLALGLAAWLRRVRGEDDAGEPITIVHPMAPELRSRAVEGGSDPRPLLALTSLFGSLIDDPAAVSTIERWLRRLYEQGAKGALAHLHTR